ncbi:Alpha-monoglucosyldiacylglycerol synthase [Jeotgalibaca dankookensis]|uniref:Alpha-monoglucosyldiacylglycerol synthase n=1 Tax=Jeotgalibaca dankookensis TaxID=708126 RepID=A0A1S6INX3_9LACT|nr:glycosyltransferase family 4 protein [Jeotgalibaca dankookensis]AQS53254.1 Alpha-monoglucosyldiacylglycerol synthase [Jeotgalibaca dankookensis]
MKVLLVTDLYIPVINGVVTSTLSLKKSLEKLGHDIRVLTLSEDDYIDKKNNIYGVSSFNVNKIYPDARVKLIKDRAVLKKIMEWEPDIIHTQSEFSTFRMAKYIAHHLSIPMVHTYHTVYEDYTHYFSPSKLAGRKVVSLLSRKILREAEYIIVPTEKVKQLLASYEVTQPIRVIPTGIQLERFNKKMQPQERKKLLEKWGIPDDKFLLLSLGRLGKEKNVEELIYFVSRLQEDVHLLIVGDGPNRAELEMYANKLGMSDRVTFTGMIDPLQVASFYQNANLFVSASTSETQGLTYIEALASALPILCRADKAMDDIVIKEKTGFQYHNFEEFEVYLNQMIQNKTLYLNMSAESKTFAHKHYSSEHFGKNVCAIYRKALETYHQEDTIPYTEWE